MNGQHHGGKGSAQRPVDQDKFNDNWDAIFEGTGDRYKENVSTPESSWVWVVHELSNGCNDFVGIFTTKAKADEFLKKHGDDSSLYGCVEEPINHPIIWPENS